MLFMNEYEIDFAAERWAGQHPILGKATRFLQMFKDEVNAHSDGWAYWRPPVQAAKQLMTMIQSVPRLGMQFVGTEEQFQKSLRPIKAFYTRRGNAAGMKFPEVF